jgi:hypothetical protein
MEILRPPLPACHRETMVRRVQLTRWLLVRARVRPLPADDAWSAR